MNWTYKVVAPNFTILCNKERWIELNDEGLQVDSDDWHGDSMSEYIQRVSDNRYDCRIIKLNLKLENK